MTKRTLLIVLTIGLIVSLSGITASSVLADNENCKAPIIQELAEAFGVEEDEVEAVFDAVREERREETRKRRMDRLKQAVEDGVITQEQLNALQKKQQEIWEEQSHKRQSQKKQMQNWFEQEDINHDALMEYMGNHHKGEFGMRERRGKFHN
jgi:hypothetical protein